MKVKTGVKAGVGDANRVNCPNATPGDCDDTNN
jgi:hypothetical protein